MKMFKKCTIKMVSVLRGDGIVFRRSRRLGCWTPFAPAPVPGGVMGGLGIKKRMVCSCAYNIIELSKNEVSGARSKFHKVLSKDFPRSTSEIT
jgi:hypothetical protein